jgi:hypothetical protein
MKKKRLNTNGHGGRRANQNGRPRKVREADLAPAAEPGPRKAFSTENIPDLTVLDVRRILTTILLNSQMPPTARVSAGRALLGRDDGGGAEAVAEAKLHQHALEILNRRVN